MRADMTFWGDAGAEAKMDSSSVRVGERVSRWVGEVCSVPEVKRAFW